MKTTNKQLLLLFSAFAFFILSAPVKAFAQPSSVTAAIGSPANGTAHHIAITWAAVGGATSYELEHSTNGTNWNNIYTGTATTYDHNAGSVGNMPQYYRVRSVSGTPSAYANATQYPIYTAADAPAVPQLTNATSSGMSLTLVPESPDPNPATTTYSIFSTTNSLYVQANGTLGASEVFQTMAAWGTVNITGLTASTNYCFYAKAKNNDGDVRTSSGSPLTNVEPFTTSANFVSGFTSSITKFWSPDCTNGDLTYFASNGCTGGHIGFSGSFNNYFGCFLRTPEQDCSGLTSVTVNFDLSHSYIPSHVVSTPSNNDAMRFYLWDNNYTSGNHYYRATSVKIGGVEKGVSDGNGFWLNFDEARTCVNVDVTFEFATAGVPNVNRLLFYLEPNCSFNDGQVFSVKIDNVSFLSSAASTACLSTTACSAATIQTHPSGQSACVNGSVSFGITTNGSVASYLWQESTNGGGGWNNISNGGIYSNANTATLTLTGVTAGMNGYLYRAVVTGSCSGNPTSNTAALTVDAGPGAAGIITGTSSICQGATGVAYSVSPVSGATSYAWSLPTGATITAGDGTASITVTFSNSAATGDIAVTPSNTCAQGGASPAFAVTVNQLPATPGMITGSTAICGSTSETYSITPVSGATAYTWTLPNGWTGSSTTETINATSDGSSGTVSVTASNSCGSSAAQTLTVSATAIPVAPSAIIGPDSVCAGSPLTLSVAAAGGSTSYNWTLPVGWTGSSNTNSITISVGNNGGNISVTAENSCGTSAAYSETFTVTPLPSVTFDFSQNRLCYNINPIALTDGTPTGGIYSGTGVTNGNFHPKNVTVGSYVVTYEYTDGNGCSGSDTSVIVVDGCTGIEDDFSSGILIYPNPFQNTFTIESQQMQIKTAIMYDAVGKEIFRNELLNPLREQIILPVSLAKGMYTLRLISDKDVSAVKKLIRAE